VTALTLAANTHAPQEPSDLELVERCRGGDAAAWECLYRAHFGFVHRLAQRLGAQTSEAEDVCQEVFLLAHRKLANFHEGQFRHWLYRFVVNVAGNRQKRRRVREALSSLWGGRPERVERTPEHDAGAREAVAQVKAVLDQMAPKKREVFVLYELEEMSGEEIAAMVGCGVNTVWTRLHHARREFEELARAQGLGYP